MKPVKNSKYSLLFVLLIFLVLCVVWIIVKQYDMLVFGALALIFVIWGYNKSLLKYDENGIEIQMLPRNMSVPWDDVVYIGERFPCGVFGRKGLIVQVKWLWGKRAHLYTVRMSYYSDGVQELLEFYQNVLREKQKDYD